MVTRMDAARLRVLNLALQDRVAAQRVNAEFAPADFPDFQAFVAFLAEHERLHPDAPGQGVERGLALLGTVADHIGVVRDYHRRISDWRVGGRRGPEPAAPWGPAECTLAHREGRPDPGLLRHASMVATRQMALVAAPDPEVFETVTVAQAWQLLTRAQRVKRADAHVAGTEARRQTTQDHSRWAPVLAAHATASESGEASWQL